MTVSLVAELIDIRRNSGGARLAPESFSRKIFSQHAFLRACSLQVQLLVEARLPTRSGCLQTRSRPWQKCSQDNELLLKSFGAPGEAWERRMESYLKPFVRTQWVVNPTRKGWPAIRKRVLRSGGATRPAKRRQPVSGPCD